MRDPKQYTTAMVTCQAGVTVVYVIIGCIMYYYCGSYVAAPALGSAGRVIKIISYAFAMPGLLVTVAIISHVRKPDHSRYTGSYSLLRPFRYQQNSSSSTSFVVLDTSPATPQRTGLAGLVVPSE